MLRIKVEVSGEGPADKVAACLREGLRQQMSASAWNLRVETEGSGDLSVFQNEGRETIALNYGGKR